MKEEPLHREILEEHAQNPKHQKKLATFNRSAKLASRKTGNACEIFYLEEEGIIKEIGVTMQGSALALACSSLMGAEVVGYSMSQASELAKKLIRFLEEGKEFFLPGDLIVYDSIKRFPERHDCALLSWRSLILAMGAPDA
ncbi:MAG: hypothetical protein CMI27_00505 [Opitutae bacterium]|nr:hypothetical protein [Opitutae bacterium]|tara:strand:+ start:18372 stop:18794 length:423 start_codon:yes stop_codon:yes gene_type:complete